MVSAIDENFERIARAAEVGTAAGYRLVSVTLAPTSETTATLAIRWQEATPAHRPASDQIHQTDVRITQLRRVT
ncbi:hypothetical protein [Micromonospora sp. WMMD1082]|uniref:hypothetical protein n=1 Tax=Micromonospora sp. WMMD1082 TaxID=3016104 RepID=UPI0024170F76|nr:hypothetical protein [Micromonospora sp. WMMD1082]MDG4792741.1 hypothetical protein [Micromonospora sp. WMMD1082]